jgi:hypothetical protein
MTTSAYFSSSIYIVKVAYAGFWAICAAVASSSGWTAPPCLISYFGSATALMLSLAVETIHYKKSKLETLPARDLVNWGSSYGYSYNHSYMVAMPQGNTLWCTEYNLSSIVPHNQWVNVTYLNTGVTTEMRHNDTNIELDMEVPAVASSRFRKRSTEQDLRRIWVIAEKMEKIDYYHASKYHYRFAKKEADDMWRLGRYCDHIYDCSSGYCSEIISSGFTLNSEKRTYERQSVKGCES